MRWVRTNQDLLGRVPSAFLSVDHEFTDWAEVRSFTADFLERAPDPIRRKARTRI